MGWGWDFPRAYFPRKKQTKKPESTGLEPATEINIKGTEQRYLTFRDPFVTVLHEKVTSTEKTTTR